MSSICMFFVSSCFCIGYICSDPKTSIATHGHRSCTVVVDVMVVECLVLLYDFSPKVIPLNPSMETLQLRNVCSHKNLSFFPCFFEKKSFVATWGTRNSCIKCFFHCIRSKQDRALLRYYVSWLIVVTKKEKYTGIFGILYLVLPRTTYPKEA